MEATAKLCGAKELAEPFQMFEIRFQCVGRKLSTPTIPKSKVGGYMSTICLAYAALRVNRMVGSLWSFQAHAIAGGLVTSVEANSPPPIPFQRVCRACRKFKSSAHSVAADALSSFSRDFVRGVQLLVCRRATGEHLDGTIEKSQLPPAFQNKTANL